MGSFTCTGQTFQDRFLKRFRMRFIFFQEIFVNLTLRTLVSRSGTLIEFRHVTTSVSAAMEGQIGEILDFLL
jgi:hypothetical protein